MAEVEIQGRSSVLIVERPRPEPNSAEIVEISYINNMRRISKTGISGSFAKEF